MDDVYLACSCAGSSWWSMHVVHGIPTVYFGSSENPKGISIKTFPSRAAMRSWVNTVTASERMNKKTNN